MTNIEEVATRPAVVEALAELRRDPGAYPTLWLARAVEDMPPGTLPSTDAFEVARRLRARVLDKL